METIVISGINLVEGGIYSVLTDCLDTIINEGLNKKFNIIALVHKIEPLKKYQKDIKLVEFPKSKSSWLRRLWYEYVYFYFYSKKIKVDIWISLHDITPNVKAKAQYVYCHNSTPFMEKNIKNIRYDYKIYMFSLFYKYLYKINIKKNTGVIVQQEWMRNEFKKLFKLNNIIVARPVVTNLKVSKSKTKELKSDVKFNFSDNQKKFIFPSYPRFFKNFEIICEACQLLDKKKVDNYEVLLTINGTENSYTNSLIDKYKNLKHVKFIGILKRAELIELYGQVDCMIFPSKLETWGLPISEFKESGKPILVSDLPYAHETIGLYEKVNFFDPSDHNELALLMKNEIEGNANYTGSTKSEPQQPYSENWSTLFNHIIKK